MWNFTIIYVKFATIIVKLNRMFLKFCQNWQLSSFTFKWVWNLFLTYYFDINVSQQICSNNIKFPTKSFELMTYCNQQYLNWRNGRRGLAPPTAIMWGLRPQIILCFTWGLPPPVCIIFHPKAWFSDIWPYIFWKLASKMFFSWNLIKNF